jgi:hypothetical protein
MLIAVGAVGLIAVGLAKLFSSTGEVVKLGRRTSTMNELAATLENQIRRDVAAMATQGEGFLVIRNKLLIADPLTINPDTGEPFGVPFSPDDRNPDPRPRRIDEIVFFTHGNYTSAREPQYPGRAPAGSAARIYYGHGMKRDSYGTPRLDADPIWSNNPAWPAGLGRPGPNQYPANWTLLRQVTVLARPQPTQWQLPAGAPSYLTANNWKDSSVQIALQPAAASIFRFDPLHLTNPDIQGWGYVKPVAPPTNLKTTPDRLPTPPASDIARTNDANISGNPWPSTASGIVDVASMDLSLIRARVVGLAPGEGLRSAAYTPYPYPQAIASHNAAGVSLLDQDPAKNIAHAQKMLMASALPGNDPWLFGAGNMARPDMPITSNAPDEQRMIYAPQPPDFTGNLTNTGTPWPADEPYRQQDQAMLSASNLAVGCTEFIVEWSFGDVYPATVGSINAPAGLAGQIIWHGLNRTVPGSAPVAPYRAGSDYSSGNVPDGLLLGSFPAGVIHWPANIPATGTPPWANNTWNPEEPVYSFFGYQDPSYAGPGTRDWPWPKLLRFTIGLTDPSDPTFEQVVQFVVEVPSSQHLQ